MVLQISDQTKKILYGYFKDDYFSDFLASFISYLGATIDEKGEYILFYVKCDSFALHKLMETTRATKHDYEIMKNVLKDIDMRNDSLAWNPETERITIDFEAVEDFVERLKLVLGQ